MRIWKGLRLLAWRFYLWALGLFDDRRIPPAYGGDPPRRLHVSCEAPIAWYRGRFLRAAATLRNITGKHVYIHAPTVVLGRSAEGDEILQGRPVPPVEDGDFHIHLWSTPRDGGYQDPPPGIFDQPYSPAGPCFCASGLGLSIQSERWPAAELVGNNLYIHCPLGMRLDTDESRIFWAIIEKASELLACSLEELQAKLEAQKIQTRQETRDAFLRLTPASETMRALALAENEFLSAEAWDRVARGRFCDARRQLNRVELLHCSEAARKAGEAQRFASEFDELMAIEQVLQVGVSRGTLEVVTKPLICTHPKTGVRHEIGAFRIIVYLDGSNGGVRWFNLTAPRPIGDQVMQAPLVREDGSTWSVAMSEVFVDFIIERSFQVVVSLAIQFIESPDPEALGVQWINRWPVAKEMQDARA